MTIFREQDGRYTTSVQHIAILVTLSSLMLWYGWTGYVSSDDGYYVQSGEGWLNQFPYVAAHFGTARAPIGIPMALSMLILGENEFGAVASTCFFFIGTLLLTYHALAKRYTATFALYTTAYLSSIPLFVLKATIPSADLPLLFFSAGSIWFFVAACEQNANLKKLLFSGIMSGIAFMAHETAAALMTIYGVLFLLGYSIPRRNYWIMAIGFAIPIMLELVYYGLLTGNPFHRLKLSMVGVAVADRIQVESFRFDDSGNLHIAQFLDPFVMLLTKHEFCLAYYFVIASLVWAFRPARIERRLDRNDKSLAWFFALSGVIWFAFSALALVNLKLLPRYYMVPTYLFALVTALWFRAEFHARKVRWALLLVAFSVFVNILGISLDNKNPLAGERALIEVLSVSSEPIRVDPYTASRSDVLCRWAGQDCARIVASLPIPGSLFFYNPRNVSVPNRFIKSPKDAASYTPSPEWQLIWAKKPAPKPIARIPAISNLKGVIPDSLFAKLVGVDPEVRLYRVPNYKIPE